MNNTHQGSPFDDFLREENLLEEATSHATARVRAWQIEGNAHMHADRVFHLEGAANFRDLGGLETTSGQKVRRGRIFRGDALHRLNQSDMERLSNLGIATLIDLRSPEELARSDPSPLIASGVRHLNVPVFDVDALPADKMPTTTLVDMYVNLLRSCGSSFRQIFRLLADAASYPAVIHCAAGKDRTGITSALILESLGVADDVIVADYAITDGNMARVIELGRAAHVDISELDIPDHLTRAMPETMESFLLAIRTEWGSITGYLGGIGVPNHEIATLAAHLLEP